VRPRTLLGLAFLFAGLSQAAGPALGEEPALGAEGALAAEPAPAPAEMRSRAALWLAGQLARVTKAASPPTSAAEVPRVAFSTAALARAADAASASPDAAAVVEALKGARSWLRRQQKPDGSFGAASARVQASWWAIAALERSDSPEDGAAVRRSERFLLGVQRRDALNTAAVVPPKEKDLRQAMEFLKKNTAQGSESLGDAAARGAGLEIFSGGRFDSREARKTIEEGFGKPGFGLCAALGLPRIGGRLQDAHLAARVLGSYRLAKIVVAGAGEIHWPQSLFGEVSGHWNAAEGAFSDAPAGPPALEATAAALLALDALAPWTAVGPGELAAAERAEPVRYADLRTDCVECHQRLQPGLILQWERSKHAREGVGCDACHGKNHSQVFRENGRVSAKICGGCHSAQLQEFRNSRHARAEETLLASALFAATPPAARSSCVSCHRTGERHADGSRGSCNFCHAGHEFQAAAAREPEACTGCHTGLDYPQDLAYRTSKHGALYRLTRNSALAPTCASCHHPGGGHGDDFGITIGGSGSGGILAGEKPPIEMREIAPQDFERRRAAMVGVCTGCHSSRFSEESLRKADEIKAEGNRVLAEAVEIVSGLHAGRFFGRAASSPAILGPGQVRADPSTPGAAVLNLFHDLWRFHYAWTWKGAYHSSPSVANVQSGPSLTHRLDEIRAEAARLRAERKKR